MIMCLRRHSSSKRVNFLTQVIYSSGAGRPFMEISKEIVRQILLDFDKLDLSHKSPFLMVTHLNLTLIPRAVMFKLNVQYMDKDSSANCT